MVLAITQQTFDEAVQENINEFGMSPEEAVAETINQFKAQGVDLSHIVTDEMKASPEEARAVTAAIKTLDGLVNADVVKTAAEYSEELTRIKTECDKGLQYRILAGKEGAYGVLLQTLTKLEENPDVVKDSLKALISLMCKQPDLLDDRGVEVIIQFLDKQKDPEILRLVLKWTKECCIMHEVNRQKIFDAAILDHLKPLLDEAGSALLRDVLGVLRALILDDDVRVEYGRAHEHARTIASDTLCSIVSLLTKFRTDEPLMNDAILTLSALLVRTEFCKKVEDAGGLELIQTVLVDFHDNDKLTRQCFKLYKALAGNDECKLHIIQKGAAPVIASSFNRHKNQVQTASAALACIAALALRAPDNSKALFDAGIPEIIVETMKLHADDANVQKNGSWAVRNMVSRSRYQCSKFIDLGVEPILKKDLKKFNKFEYDMKAALRDLGCQVDLKEAWTGKGGLLTSESKH